MCQTTVMFGSLEWKLCTCTICSYTSLVAELAARLYRSFSCPCDTQFKTEPEVHVIRLTGRARTWRYCVLCHQLTSCEHGRAARARQSIVVPSSKSIPLQ